MEPAVEDCRGVADGAGVDDVVLSAPEPNENAGPPVDGTVEVAAPKAKGATGVLTVLWVDGSDGIDGVGAKEKLVWPEMEGASFFFSAVAADAPNENREAGAGAEVEPAVLPPNEKAAVVEGSDPICVSAVGNGAEASAGLFCARVFPKGNDGLVDGTSLETATAGNETLCSSVELDPLPLLNENIALLLDGSDASFLLSMEPVACPVDGGAVKPNEKVDLDAGIDDLVASWLSAVTPAPNEKPPAALADVDMTGSSFFSSPDGVAPKVNPTNVVGLVLEVDAPPPKLKPTAGVRFEESTSSDVSTRTRLGLAGVVLVELAVAAPKENPPLLIVPPPPFGGIAVPPNENPPAPMVALVSFTGVAPIFLSPPSARGLLHSSHLLQLAEFLHEH